MIVIDCKFIRVWCVRLRTTVPSFVKLVASTTALSWLVLPQYSLAAANFQVDGRMSVRSVDEKGSALQTFDITFTVVVNSNQWNIRVVKAGDEVVKQHEVAFDGKEITHVSEYQPKALKPTSKNVAVGYIENVEIPRNYGGNIVQPLWLAFASGHYFRNATTNVVPGLYTMWAPYTDVTTVQFPFTGEFSQSDPYLPVRLAARSTNFMVSKDGGLVQFPLPPQYTEGYPVFVYEQVEPAGGRWGEIPKKFSFKEYMPKSKPNGAHDFQLVCVTEGTVTKFSAAESAPFQVKLPGVIWASDFRFANLPEKATREVTYPITNGVWPQVSDVTGTYQQHLKHEEIAKKFPPTITPTVERKSKGWLRIALVAAVCIIPPIILLLKTKKKHPHEKKM